MSCSVFIGIDVSQARNFWAFQPPQQHPLPQVKNSAWPRGDIDRFILARLEQQGLSPVADTDRATLLRHETIRSTLPTFTPEITTGARSANPPIWLNVAYSSSPPLAPSPPTRSER